MLTLDLDAEIKGISFIITIVIRRAISLGLITDLEPTVERQVLSLKPDQNENPIIKQVAHLQNKVALRPIINEVVINKTKSRRKRLLEGPGGHYEAVTEYSKVGTGKKDR